jgi:hypothetical protein
LGHYFHPATLGRTSIKAVLPAVWNQSAALRSHPWFKDYQKTDADGSVMDPYKTLPRCLSAVMKKMTKTLSKRGQVPYGSTKS